MFAQYMTLEERKKTVKNEEFLRNMKELEGG
jgi:hypothetical protein